MPDESPATTGTAGPDGIWADVTIDVILEPYAAENDRISSTVTISATNRTKSDIVLKDPYQLPARKVQNVTSTLENNDNLDTTKTKNKLLVFFADRKLPAGETLKWTVKYVRMAELYLNHILAYDLFIDPQRIFQNVPIINHHLKVRVTLLTPDDARWRPLRRWHLHQRNYPLSVNSKISQSREQAICDFGTFDLTDESFDLRIAAVYGFKSWIAHAFELAVGAALVVLLEHGPALLMKLWHLWH